MNKFTKNLSIICACALMLSSCANNGGISKQAGGAGVGAVAGGILGSVFGKGEGKFLAIGAGALIGALAGSYVGKSMDDQDRLMAERSSQNALENTPSGKSIGWKNPDSGHYGSVTPTRTYQASSGDYCREYTHSVNVGGREEEAYGTACRQQDGSWKIVR